VIAIGPKLNICASSAHYRHENNLFTSQFLDYLCDIHGLFILAHGRLCLFAVFFVWVYLLPVPFVLPLAFSGFLLIVHLFFLSLLNIFSPLFIFHVILIKRIMRWA
jgi:hypothetical protein